MKKQVKRKPRIISVKTGSIWIAAEGDKKRQGFMVILTGLDSQELRRLRAAAAKGKLLVDRIDTRITHR